MFGFAHHGVVLIGVAVGGVCQIALGLERAHHGGECVEVGLGVGIEGYEFSHEHRSVLPEEVHYLLLLACQSFH